MALLGPNTVGMVNARCGAAITFMDITPVPLPARRAIGLVSQSGALGMALAQAVTRGVSFSHVLTSGNSCDIDMADCVAYLVDDPACAVIACLFEGMSEPERLLAAAELAWQADKPLVVYKMATGEEGAAAALSHTGSLAGSYAAYRAAFRRAGVCPRRGLRSADPDRGVLRQGAAKPTGAGCRGRRRLGRLLRSWPPIAPSSMACRCRNRTPACGRSSRRAFRNSARPATRAT